MIPIFGIKSFNAKTNEWIAMCVIALMPLGWEGCASSELLYRCKSFEYSNRAFDCVTGGKEFCHKVHIPAFDLHLVNDCCKFKWDYAKEQKNGVVGYYNLNTGNIWLLGKYYENRYYFNQ